MIVATARWALLATALAAAGCATTPVPKDNLAGMRRLGVVEPRAVDIYVQVGTPSSGSTYFPPAKGVTPAASATANALGGVIYAALDSLYASRSAALTSRFRERCPDHAARLEALRQSAAAHVKDALSPRFDATVIPRAAYESSAATAGLFDGFLVLDVEALLWAPTDLMDYRPVLRGKLTLMNSDGTKPVAVRDVLIQNPQGATFPGADDVVARCETAIVALGTDLPLLAQRVALLLGNNSQENR